MRISAILTSLSFSVLCIFYKQFTVSAPKRGKGGSGLKPNPGGSGRNSSLSRSSSRMSGVGDSVAKNLPDLPGLGAGNRTTGPGGSVLLQEVYKNTLKYNLLTNDPVYALSCVYK